MGTKEAKARAELSFPVMPVVLLVLLAAGGGAFYYMQQRGPRQEEPVVLTPEAKAYTRNLKLSEVSMQATESYAGQEVVEINGKIANNGDQVLSLVEVNCVFYDTMNQVVLRERVPIVRAKGGPLKPGETRAFRMPFDSLPQSWNKDMPQLVIARMQFVAN